MSTFKLMVDPVKAVRESTKEKVNTFFTRLATTDVHRDQVYMAKRVAAQNVLAGGTAYPEWNTEAELRNMSLEDFAKLILSKDNAMNERELWRQRIMMSIEQAQSTEALVNILKVHNVSVTND